MFFRRVWFVGLLLCFPAQIGRSATGTEGASFLDIPVGGGPAALGSAYSAQATDAYAPVWNPAGLGFLSGAEFTGMHLSYLGPLHYEHASFVLPLSREKNAATASSGLGGSVQYLGASDLDARDENGNPAGTFKTSFTAYTLAYGQKLTDQLSTGLSGKLISENIADASASAYASDWALLYKPNDRLSLAGVLANFGSSIKFVDESDPLPTAARFGGWYRWSPEWSFSGEGVYRKTGLFSGSVGMEWSGSDEFCVRTGYNTSHVRELGFVAGITAGFGITLWGQEFAYAWVPYGDLGQTHTFSLVFRTITRPRPERPRMRPSADNDFDDMKSEHSGRYQNILDDLTNNERHTLQ